ncbi:MAG: indolepyruvate ferredoxin oxidoreductase family protein [Acidimicrobiia bacterium]|nr:indolepyruvate ferredoxin oxidoreductase family protein [Acidimicrobiia bacterium]
MTTEAFRLEDRLAVERGTVALTGIQALLRILIDQHRADRATGLRTATLLSGYRGSPVGGVDLAFQQNEAVLRHHDVTFLNSVNEDLAATSVWGSQMATLMDDPAYDGVLGMWYGKAPGIDRSGDALRHANFAGVDPNGGVLCVAGDDPGSKSSTLPSASEWALQDLAMPILYPGTVQEILDFGRLGYSMSRFSGLWVALKIHTDVADAYATVSVGPDRIQGSNPEFTVAGGPWGPARERRLIAPWSLSREQELFEVRTQAALAYGRHNRIDTTDGPTDAWIGIVAAGKPYYDVLEALTELGIPSPTNLGIRLLKPGSISPLDPAVVREFAAGLEEIVVVEEKRGFIESQVRNALYDLVDRPRVLGKKDDAGRTLVPVHGALEPSIVAPALRARLARRIPRERLTGPRRRLDVIAATPAADIPGRTPYFCSGCPHNRSTAVPDGSTAGGGIGCHGMVMLIPSRPTEDITHMGGEGAQWVGAAPFVGTPHRFQNLGDGTLFHSGSLAIRQAIAAGTSVTYKILYNGVVAMTGGQDAAGEMPVPELTRMLEAEGVRKTIVVSDDTTKYPTHADFAHNTSVWSRDRLEEAQRDLRELDGVTVLIYDQACAANLRRERKRGRAPTPEFRAFINEAVCEGCGHCGEISNCLSVHPVDTLFGRKTQIHQESCNFDFTCLDGNCPAFVKVKPSHRERKKRPLPPIGRLPEPAVIPAEGNLLLVGIGGTGVVTANQIIATAALLDGKHASSLDQTGLSQKGGPVVSNLKITREPASESNRIGDGTADAYLAFDLLTAASSKNLIRADPERTTAVVSTSRVPTGAMVTNIDTAFPDLAAFRAAIDPHTRPQSHWFDAERLARELFQNQAAANLIVIGVAYQLGIVPASAASLERAIELNGVAVEMNTEAFAVGRALIADPERVDQILPAPQRDLTPKGVDHDLVPEWADADPELAAALRRWIPYLTAYQDRAYADRYLATVGAAANARPGQFAVAVADGLGKLMAYKDEYEVARLHLDPGFAASIRDRFGERAATTYLLKPPTMTQLGLRGKIAMPSWAGRPLFKMLYRMRRLRGTAIDPFGRSEERTTERRLITEYQALVEEMCRAITPDNAAELTRIARLPDMVRGYDEIKLANVARYRTAVERGMDPIGA